METKADFDAAAAHLFGSERLKDAAPRPYKSEQYAHQLGIDIQQYGGFYCEVGAAESPVGPVVPASERLLIKPILTIRQSRSGRYYVQSMEFPSGLFSQDKSRCWIKTQDYDEMLGDDYFDRIEEQVKELVDAAELAAELADDQETEKKPVQILGLGSLSESERAVFDKLREGVEFADLTQQERDMIATAMEQQGDKSAEQQDS